jgi:hypothetical protein
MSRSIKYSTCPAAAILLAALLCACRPELEPSSAAAFLPPGRGGVSVSMPALSPALAKALGLVPTAKAAAKTESAVPRTYLGLNRIEMVLLDSNDAEISTATIYLDQVNYVTANAQGTLLADPGADFRIEVEIYNTFVSNTVPVCSGVSEPFAITAGNLTEVAVTCVPISATALEVGTESSAIELEPGLYDCDNYSFVTGGEAWYSFVATSTSMEVITTPIDATALGYIVTFATAEGNPVAGDGSIVPAMDILTGDPPVFSSRIVTMIGQTYYLGVMSMDFKITGDVYVPAGNLRIMVTPAPSATPTPAPSATPTPEPSASPEPMPSPSPIPTP